MSTKKKTSSKRSESKKEQLQKVIFGIIEDDEKDSTTDYAAAFSNSAQELDIEPEENRLIDIYKLNPAPEEWNFYSPLPDEKMFEMIDSILNIGLQEAIIVWEQEDQEQYMILSGHNRVRAFKMIYSETQNEKYRYIPARVYKHHQIDENKAKEIIIDTNWVKRTLTPMEKAKSIKRRIDLINQRRKSEKIKGETRDIAAKVFNLTGRTIGYYQNLPDLIEPYAKLVDEYKLPLRIASKIATLNPEVQHWLYENYRYDINSSNYGKIHRNMTKEEVEKIIQESKEKRKTKINIEIPAEKEDEFVQLLDKWIKEKELSLKDYKVEIK